MGFDANAMMLDLFRAEVESHSESLTGSLLQLEREQPDKTFFDSMMRAAHSIKGAARIVGVQPVVDISHVMEDCFVAAQRGELALGPDHVDVMLRGVDLMVKISEGTKDTAADTLALTPQIEAVVAHLRSIRSGQPVVAPTPSTIDSPASSQPVISQPVISQPVATQPAANRPSTTQPPAESSVPQPTKPTKLQFLFGSTLDESHAQRVRTQLLEQWHNGILQVDFDLSQTTEIDAVGLAFLASATHFVAQSSHAQLVMQPISAEMQMVLRVAGVNP